MAKREFPPIPSMPREPAGRQAASFRGAASGGCDKAPLARDAHVRYGAHWCHGT
jgi:hypothetical protein